MCVPGGRKCSFFGKFGKLCFLISVLRFALLPCNRQNTGLELSPRPMKNLELYLKLVLVKCLHLPEVCGSHLWWCLSGTNKYFLLYIENLSVRLLTYSITRIIKTGGKNNSRNAMLLNSSSNSNSQFLGAFIREYLVKLALQSIHLQLTIMTVYRRIAQTFYDNLRANILIALTLSPKMVQYTLKIMQHLLQKF